jgi:uncharacterized protein YqfA (UPF0365 family)
MPELIVLFVIGFIALIFLILFVWLIPVALWVSAWFAGVRVAITALVGMRLRRVNPHHIVQPMIVAHKAGLKLTSDQLETHYLATNRSAIRVASVVTAVVAADRANIELSWERATAIDLAGRDVLEAVSMSVKPKVIDAPDPSRGSPVVAAVAKDGIQLKAKARVTVRANLERLVGGATEETIIARVGEGIVTTIGSAETHKQVLENPDLISKKVLEKGLDAGTGFEILSVDIADVDVGDNIGAALQIDQANADKQIAQAKAEERKAMAIAREQEMRATVEQMRAKVVEAEAQVPLAMAEALRSGNLGVMDYFQLKNILADTQMRDAISRRTEKPGESGDSSTSS